MLVNGIPTDQVPLSDRGLQYGDGLFETIAVIDSKPRAWHRHMVRLARGESALGIPETDKEQLYSEALSLSHGLLNGVLKIIVTRGSGGRGYRPPEVCKPRRILSLHNWPDYPDHWFTEGVQLRVCETRWSRNSRLSGLKHLNRLEQVLARQEWQDPEIAEGLMLDEAGSVISATQSNLFAVVDGELVTPDLSQSGIAGVMRELVIECAGKLGIPVRIAAIDVEGLKQADALFLTNSIMGICPVAALSDHRFKDHKPAAKLRHEIIEAIAGSA